MTYDKQKVKRLSRIREIFSLRKKNVEAKCYPYQTIDPYEIFGLKSLFTGFKFVGSEWKKLGSTKPVSLFWGFNDWKLGFVSEYMSEYRTAFAPRKISLIRSLFALGFFSVKPKIFVFWGYTEPFGLSHYAKLRGIKIFRMEDGFLRSAALGAEHTTPYSLVLDSRGLYFNPKVESDLEFLIRNCSFTKQELLDAEYCLQLFKVLRLSKYNPVSLESKRLGEIKIRRVIAILGQVKDDSALKFGNTKRLTALDLIMLANNENPGCEILYRPHPQTFQNIKAKKSELKALERYCKIVSPNTSLADFLDSVDHVYTINSTSGFEALLLGVQVTLLGIAFYGGWGLTDDRVQHPRRNISKTTLELFACAYLQYPRYLGDKNDSILGFTAACYRIKVDKEINQYELYKAVSVAPDRDKYLSLSTDYMIMILFQHGSKFVLTKNAINNFNLKAIFSSHAGKIYQVALAYGMCGLCPNNQTRDFLLTQIRRMLSFDVLNELLLDLAEIHAGAYIYRHVAWLLAEVGEHRVSSELLREGVLEKRSDVVALLENSAALPQLNTDCAPDEMKANESDRAADFEFLLATMVQASSLRNFDLASEIAKNMLLSGHLSSQVFHQLLQIATWRYDLSSVRLLANLLSKIDLYERNRKASWILMTGYDPKSVESDGILFRINLVKLFVLKPDKINDINFIRERFFDLIGDLQDDRIMHAVARLDNDLSVRKVYYYIAAGLISKAIETVEHMILNGMYSESVRIAYSQALSFNGDIEAAFSVMSDLRSVKDTASYYTEILRLCILSGDYSKGLKVLEQAFKNNIDIGEMYARKIYFGAGFIDKAFQTFMDLPLRKALLIYYSDKYLSSLVNACEAKSILFLSIFGPGDEIRFASVYGRLPSLLPHVRVVISCLPRLRSLMQRSFPFIDFVPVERPRNSDLFDVRKYSLVPGADLFGALDNDGIMALRKVDSFVLVTDLLHRFLREYSDFDGTSYLIANQDLIKLYRHKLPSDKFLVGLSWRSSIITHSRTEHYLSVEDLEPLFNLPNVQYVNFQYDDCKSELDWINSRYPGRIINFTDVDHYNDFESVAALMQSMDLIIAPCNTVVELAGALGCPTLLISLSSELTWRKRDADGIDVWHSSVTHVEGSVFGDRGGLVIQLCNRIKALVDENLIAL